MKHQALFSSKDKKKKKIKVSSAAIIVRRFKGEGFTKSSSTHIIKGVNVLAEVM